MKKMTPITNDHRELLKAKFYEAKRHHRAIFNGIKFSDIGLYWWIKPCAGGYTGLALNAGGARIYFKHKNLKNRICTAKRKYFILLDSQVIDNTERLLKTFLHELAHVIAPEKTHHGKKFKQINAKFQRYNKLKEYE